MPRRQRSLSEYFAQLAQLLEAGRVEGEEALYLHVAALAGKATGATQVQVLVPLSAALLRIAGCCGEPPMFLEQFPVDRGIIGAAFQRRRAILVGNVRQEPLTEQGTGEALQYFKFNPAVWSELAVPILDARTGQVEVVINVESEERDHFRQGDVDVLQSLGQLLLACRDGLRERDAIAEVLWWLPDEVMVIDEALEPAYANEVKRGNLPRLDQYLPRRRVSEANLATLLAGKGFTRKEGTRQQRCFEVIEGRSTLCPFCICNKAIRTGKMVEGVVYAPENLDFIVELSATPLRLQWAPRDGKKVVGCTETVRYVTKREQVLEVAPRLMQAIQDSPDEKERLQVIVNTLSEKPLDYDRVRLHKVQAAGEPLVLRGILCAGRQPGIDGESFSKHEIRIPQELEVLRKPVVEAAKAALVTWAEGNDAVLDREQARGYWHIWPQRDTAISTIDPDGRLGLANVDEIVMVPLVEGQERFILCIDQRESRRRFTHDDLQALTVYARLASAALELARQREWQAQLAILGDVSAARTHDLARAALAIKGFDAPGHLQEVIREAARCWESQTSSPEGVRCLGEAFCRWLEPGEVVPVVGDAEVRDSAEKLQVALDKAGVSVPAGPLWELARVVRPSDAGSPELVEGIKCLGGEAWGFIEELVDLVLVTTGVRYTVEQFGEFMDIVAAAFPEEWQSEGARVVDLTGLARHVLRAFSGQAQQYQVHMDGTGLSPEKLLVEVKYGQVLLAALTLVDNAVYAAREASNQARVMLETRLVDTRPTLLISNNGSPIPDELECKIFKGPVPSKKSRGMGHGLLLAGGLVRANHGIIQLRRNYHEGMTTFELSFGAARS